MTTYRTDGPHELKPGDPVPFGGSQILEAQAFIEREAFARYLVAFVAEFPEVRAELRRLLLEEPSAERGQGEDPGAEQGQAEAGEGVVDGGPQT